MTERRTGLQSLESAANLFRNSAARLLARGKHRALPTKWREDADRLDRLRETLEEALFQDGQIDPVAVAKLHAFVHGEDA